MYKICFPSWAALYLASIGARTSTESGLTVNEKLFYLFSQDKRCRTVIPDIVELGP